MAEKREWSTNTCAIYGVIIAPTRATALADPEKWYTLSLRVISVWVLLQRKYLRWKRPYRKLQLLDLLGTLQVYKDILLEKHQPWFLERQKASPLDKFYWLSIPTWERSIGWRSQTVFVGYFFVLWGQQEILRAERQEILLTLSKSRFHNLLL